MPKYYFQLSIGNRLNITSLLYHVPVKDVVFLNEKSNIAIVSLWTKKEVILDKIKFYRDKVHAIGTLYTSYGINYLLHTLGERPSIDTLILYGSDLSGSGTMLSKLFKNLQNVKGLKLLWNLEKIKPILETTRIVDLREAYKNGDWKILKETIDKLYNPGRNVRPILRLELIEIKAESWDPPISGLAINETSLFKAWLKAVYAVMSFGSVKESEYREKQKQLLNLVVSLNFYGKHYEAEREFFQYIPEHMFEEHARSLVNSYKPEHITYTYGERLNAHPLGGNQLRKIVEKLKNDPSTRRAIAVLWHHSIDMESKDPPCIITIQGDVTGEYYNHTVYIRSNDMFSAWPLNMYGQIRLAEKIALELGLKVGIVTTISCSAHIYQHDWNNAWNLIHENYDRLAEFTPDPRGNYLIYLENSGVVVEHRAFDGSKAGELKLKSPKDYRALKAKALLLSPDHAFYLGWETRKALEKFSRREKYVQDEDIP